MDLGKSCIARMRLFGKLPITQIAFYLGLSQQRIEREWRFTRAWLGKEVGF